MVDERENENAYTHIIPDTKMVVMNRDTYINVDQSELKQCIKFSVMYFCEQTFLMKHTSEHTCETAIYHEQNPDIIMVKCAKFFCLFLWLCILCCAALGNIARVYP